MKLTTRLIAMLLLVCMVLSMLPTVAFAASEETPDEAPDAAIAEETEAEPEERDLPDEYISEEEPEGKPERGLGRRTPENYAEQVAQEQPASSDKRATAKAATFDSYYNSAEKGYITPIRNQGSYGTCWAHGAMAACEAYMIKHGVKVGGPNGTGNAATTSLNLSESHLAWFGYSAAYDKEDMLTGDKSTPDSDYRDLGGFGEIPTYTLMRWEGLASESPSALTYSSMKASGLNSSYAYQYNVAHVQDAIWIPTSDRDAVKAAIMEYGAGIFGYYSDDNYENSNGACYYPSSKSSNHDVTVVGWDDNYSKENFLAKARPSADGAWIIKNSWGTSYGTNGYYYISYYDVPANNDTCYFFKVEDVDNYDHNYQYDGTCNFNDYMQLKRNGSVANVFTAKGDEVLEAVSFCNKTAGMTYKCDIYKNLTSSNPTSGTLVSSQTGTFEYAGYHTVELNTTVELSEYDKFSVVFTNTGSNTINIGLDKTGASSGWVSWTHSSPSGVSFYTNSGTWTDYSATANLRIKAYTVDSELPAYTVNVVSNNNTYGTATLSGRTITAAPKNGYYASGVTVSPANAATVTQDSQDRNLFTVSDVTADCTVTVNFAAKTPCTISFTGSSDTVNPISTYVGDTFTFPTAAGHVTGFTFVGWCAEEVNAVDSVTYYTPATELTATGSVTYHALFSYVSGGSGDTGDYVKVTNSMGLTPGQYLIVNETASAALDGSLDIIDANNDTIKVTISGNTIPSDAITDRAAFTFNPTNGSFKSSKGYYIGHTGSSNTLNTSDSALTNEVSIDSDEDAVISNGSYYLYYNSNANRFRYYSSGMQPVQLYKKGSGTILYTTNPVVCNHDWQEDDRIDATCTEEGTILYVCSLCGSEKYEDIPALGHSYQYTYYDNNQHDVTCARSGCTYSVRENCTISNGKCTLCHHQLPDYTVTFNVLGYDVSTASCKAGETVTLPTVNAKEGDYSFAGWVTHAITSEITTAPTPTVAAGATTYQPDRNITLYALYTKTESGSGSGGGDYEKVTSSSDLTNGQYLVVYESDNVAFNGALTTLDAVSNTISVTISNNKIASNTTNDAAAFTFDSSKGSFKGTGGKYFGNASNSNALTSSDTALTNTVTISGGNANIISSGGAYLRYNKASNQLRFRYYKSSSYTGQEAIQLYKKSSGSTTTTIYYTTLPVQCEHTNAVANAAKAATCEGEGNTAYWYCPNCNKYFSDAACTTLTSLTAVKIAPLGHEYSPTAAQLDTVNHKYACTRSGCTAYVTEAHTFADTRVGDVITYTCRACSYSYTKQLGTFTVTLSVMGETTTKTAVEGDVITLSAQAAPEGYTFAGWSTQDPREATTTEPVLLGREYEPTADITLYAVFSIVETEGEGSGSADSFTLTADLTDGDYMFGATYSSKVMVPNSSVNASGWLECSGFTPNGEVLTNSDASYIWTLTNLTGGGFTLKNKATGKYLYLYGTKANSAVTDSESHPLYTTPIVYGESFALRGEESGNQMAFNADGNAYRCYANLNANDKMRTEISFYKAGAASVTYYTTDPEIPCEHPDKQTTAAVEATCTADGNAEYFYCPDCGNYYIVTDNGDQKISLPAEATAEQIAAAVAEAVKIGALGHDYTYAQIANNSENHTVGCSRCDYSATDVHIWGTPVIDKTNRTSTQTCILCDYEYVTALQGCTVTFYDKDGRVKSTVSYVQGDTIAAADVPTVAAIRGYTFKGWFGTTYEATTAPTLVNPVGMTVTSDMEFHAVYAEQSGTGNPEQMHVITALDQLEDGMEIAIVNWDNEVALNSNSIGKSTVDRSTGSIPYNSNYVWTLKQSGSNWTLTNGNGNTLGVSSTALALTTTNNIWQITEDENFEEAFWLRSTGAATYVQYYNNTWKPYATIGDKYTRAFSMELFAADATISGYTTNPTEPAKYTVTYSVDYDTDVITAANDYSGEKITLPNVTGTNVPEGYVFKGWLSTTYGPNDTAPTGLLAAGSSYTIPTENVTLYAVFAQQTTGGSSNEYKLVTSTSDLVADGKYVLIGYYSTNKEYRVATTIFNSNGYLETATISAPGSDGKVTITATNAAVFTLGGSSGAWTFTDNNSKVLSAASNTTLSQDGTKNKWAISISGAAIATGGATITNNDYQPNYRILYNGSSPRFKQYNSNLSASMVLPNLYKQQSSVVTSGYTTQVNGSPKYQVSVGTCENGTITVAEGKYTAGTELTVSASPAAGFAFSAWSLTGTVDGQNYTSAITGNTLTVPAADVTLTATFIPAAANEYTVTTSSTAGGSVTSDTQLGKEDDLVTLTVTPAEHYHLESLIVDGTNVTEDVKDGTYSFNLPDHNVAVSATFAEDAKYTVTFAQTAGGTLSADKTENIYAGETVTLTAAANTHYTFNNNWTCTAGGAVITGNTFVMPASNVTITGTFTEDTKYTVTIDPATVTGGTLSASKTEGIYAGEIITLTAAPDAHYTFDGWTVTPDTLVIGTDGKFTMPAANVTLSGSFTEDAQYTVTFYDVDGHAAATKTYYVNETVPATDIPAIEAPEGYIFKGWYGTAYALNATEPTYADISAPITANTEFHAVYAKLGEGSGASETFKLSTSYQNITYYVGKQLVLNNDSKDALAAESELANAAELGIDEGGYLYFIDNETKYYISHTASTTVKILTDKTGVNAWTVSESNGKITFRSKQDDDRYFAFNYNNKDRFAAYAPTTSNPYPYQFTKIACESYEGYTTNPVVTYSITVTQTSGGTLDADKTKAAQGETVTLTATPENGYVFLGWTVTDANGDPVTVTENAFTMPAANVTVTGSFAKELKAENDIYVLESGKEIVLNVLANDIYVDGTTVTVVSQPSQGSANANTDGTITYTPSGTLNGEVTFTYQISADGLEAKTATVTLTPAAVVYYDETDSDAFTFALNGTPGTGWTEVTDSRLEELAKEGKTELDGFVMYSGGTAKEATVSNANPKDSYTVDFSFAGTGIELLAATTGTSGTALVTVKKGGALVSLSMVDTYRGYTYYDTPQTIYILKQVDRYKAVEGEEGETVYEKYPGSGEISGYTLVRNSSGNKIFGADCENDDGTINTGYVEVNKWYSGNAGEHRAANTFTEDASGSLVVIEQESKWVPQKSESGDCYQIPVLQMLGLDYGTYDVTVTVSYNGIFDRTGKGEYSFIFDGVEIHDPINNEADYRYINLRSALLGSESLGEVKIGDCKHKNLSDWTLAKAAGNGTEGTFKKTCIDCGETYVSANFTVTAKVSATSLLFGETATLSYEIGSDNAELDTYLNSAALSTTWTAQSGSSGIISRNGTTVTAVGAGNAYVNLKLELNGTTIASAVHTLTITVSEHRFSDDWTHIEDSDPSKHAHFCTVDGCTAYDEATAENCTFTNEVTTQPTTTSAGVMTYTCSVCDYQYTEEIPMLEGEYTANFYVNGELVSTEAGTTITLPAKVDAPATCDAHSYTFAGWVKSNVAYTSTAPAPADIYVANASYMLTADSDFYALYTYNVVTPGTSGTPDGYYLATKTPEIGDEIIIATVVNGTYYALPNGNSGRTTISGVPLTVVGDKATATNNNTFTYAEYQTSGYYAIQSKADSSQWLALNANLRCNGWAKETKPVEFRACTEKGTYTINGTGSTSSGYAISANGSTFGSVSGSGTPLYIFMYQEGAEGTQDVTTTYYTTNPGHKEIRNAVAATCTADGFSGDVYCSECNEKLEAGETIQALGHSYEVTASTATQTTYTCSRCGNTYNEAIELEVRYALQPGVEISGNSRSGNSITLPNTVVIPAFYNSHDSYTLVGWETSNTVTASEDTTYAMGQTVTISADTTFYPVYSYTTTEGGGTSTNFEKFTGSIVEGDYLITYDNGAMKASVSSDRLDCTEIIPANNVVSNPAANLIWHIAPSGSYVTIYNASTNSYAAATGAKNKAKLSGDGTADESLWTASGSSTYEFVNKLNKSKNVNSNLRRNGTYGFAAYSSSTGGALTLYKAASGTITMHYTFELETAADSYTAALNTSSLTMNTGSAASLTATLYNNGAVVTAEYVSFSSSNDNIVMVDDSTGYLVAGETAGSATVTVEMLAPDGEVYEATCAVTVRVQSGDITVNYIGSKTGNVYNWGTRDTPATFQTALAADYYTGSYSYATLSALTGSSASGTDFYSSALGTAIHSMLVAKQTSTTSYAGTTSLYAYTDCTESGGKISSYYSGVKIGPAWDSGSTWNREHTWPNSKGKDGSDENDIMMLRPTSVSENSDRQNKAYGEGSAYYDPNSEGRQLHGDVARLMLQHLMRWGYTEKFYGTGGVIENRTILLKWLAEDPVDTWELGRNDAVQRITGVRNVFVDYPELAFKLLGAEVPTGYTTPSQSGVTAKATYASSKPSGYEVLTYGTKSVSANHSAAKTAALPETDTGMLQGAIIVDGLGTITSMADFEAYGPKYGIYLAPGQALIFTLNGAKPTELAIGAKALNGTAAQLDVWSVGNGASVNLLEKPIASAVEQYYTIDRENLGWTGTASDVIVLYNSGEGILDVTQLRYPIGDSELTLNVGAETPKSAVKMIREIYGIPETNPDDIEDVSAIGFKSANLSLNSDIAINFNVDEAVYNSLENAYVVFTKALYNEAGEITGYAEETVREADLTDYGYSFRFKGINPAELGSEVTATLYGTVDGELVKSETRTYSVLDYINNMYAKGSNAAFNTMLADLAFYGAAAQQYVGYNTANLVTDRVSAELLTCGTEDAPTLNNRTAFEENANASVEFASAYLSLRDKVTVCYKLDLSKYEGSVNDLELRIAYVDYDGSDKTVVISGSDFTEAKGRYIVSFSGLNAVQMRTVLNAAVYASDTCVSDILSYSIESYAAAKAAGNDALANLVLALMRYGDSACAVFEK